MGSFKLNSRHLLDIRSLGRDGIEHILSRVGEVPSSRSAQTALLFFEHSTRTRLSFELAAKQLGNTVLTPSMTELSIQKGETKLDTIMTVAALGVDQIVLRCSEKDLLHEAAALLGEDCCLINAGDGSDQHPSQALTDLSILNDHCNGDWSSLSVGIVGNVSHSRVANSLIDGLQLVGAGNIRLIGPDAWLPDVLPEGVQTATTLGDSLQGLDALVVLRAQWERMPDASREEVDQIQNGFCLDVSHVLAMNAGAIVMHPGPVLRDKEITSALLKHDCVKVDQQVRRGVLVRQVLLDLFSPGLLT